MESGAAQSDGDSELACKVEPGIARERYLVLIDSMKGRRVELTMHEKTRVGGIFETMNMEGTVIAISALDTPLGQQDSVLLRATDIISMSVDLI